MQEQTIREPSSRSLTELAEIEEIAERDLIKKLEAQVIVDRNIATLKEQGKVISLSDEEFDLLESFRRFKLRLRKNGDVFKWQTTKPEGIVITKETAEVIHPRELL